MPIEVPPNAENRRYLETKREKLGHRAATTRTCASTRGSSTERSMSERAARAAPRVEDPEAGRGRGGGATSRRSEVATKHPWTRRSHEAGDREHAPGELARAGRRRRARGRAAGGRRAVAIVVSRFNGEITGEAARVGARGARPRGVPRERVTVMPVPGAFELRSRRWRSRRRGGTHASWPSAASSAARRHIRLRRRRGRERLQLAALETGVPVAFGVLTLETADQADTRVDKGAEAVRSGLEMVDAFQQLRAAASAGARVSRISKVPSGRASRLRELLGRRPRP